MSLGWVTFVKFLLGALQDAERTSCLFQPSLQIQTLNQHLPYLTVLKNQPPPTSVIFPLSWFCLRPSHCFYLIPHFPLKTPVISSQIGFDFVIKISLFYCSSLNKICLVGFTKVWLCFFLTEVAAEELIGKAPGQEFVFLLLCSSAMHDFNPNTSQDKIPATIPAITAAFKPIKRRRKRR